MKLKVTGLFRQSAIDHDRSQPPGKDNPGGGLAKKIHQLSLALPNIQMVSNLSHLGDITIMEPHSLTDFELPEGRDFFEMLKERAEMFAKYPGYKILWTSDVELFRFEGVIREMLVDGADIVAGNSQYMVDLLSAYVDPNKLALLTDPVDHKAVTPGVKEPIIYGCSQVIVEKGISELVALYKELEGVGLERHFVGSVNTWGVELKETVSCRLEKALGAVCDKHTKSIAANDMPSFASNAWCFTSFAGYESFGYAMIEALLAGCWVFCGDHPVYRDRPVKWFSSPVDASLAIMDFVAEHDLQDINEEGRNFVIDNYALSVFRDQFRQIVGSNF